MMNILITEPDDYSQDALNIYSEFGNVFLGTSPNEEAINILVVKLNIHVNSSFLEKFPHLKFIITPTTGLTHIDVKFCNKELIQIISLNDCRHEIQEISSTAELALGLMIALVRKITHANEDTIHKGVWNRNLYKSRQLKDMTIGIIGLGRIGSTMSSYCKSLGMDVIAYDPFIPRNSFEEIDVKQVSLKKLLKNSAIISIHANLHSENIHMISSDELDLMPLGTLLINTARGALLDEAAVCNAIKLNKIGGIAVDVLEQEHSDEGVYSSELLSLAKLQHNIIITPHIGGCTIDAMHSTEFMIAKAAKIIIEKAS